jgi:alpha-methylacyl-CoA racemase
MSGPLTGVRIIEIGSIGPGPFAAMMLADMGADVLRLDRVGPTALSGLLDTSANVLHRNRPSVAVDLKHPEGRALVARLCAEADGLIEGFRPGVMERLGLGPETLLTDHPRLVYGRMTGYGQDGPMSQVAGHDINYISLAGALGTMQRAGERPMFPCNLLGDFGGGGLLMAFGMVCALLEARESGLGQVIDASMVDGAAVLSTGLWAMQAAGHYDSENPGTSFVDSGAHWYEVYETADGRYLSVGSLEPQFYARLLELLGISEADVPQWTDWANAKRLLTERFRTRTLADWVELLEHEDACVTPVPRMHEAPSHPHNAARQTFVELDGIVQPAPAPRFSRTRATLTRGASRAGADTDTALAAWGVTPPEIDALRKAGAVSCAAGRSDRGRPESSMAKSLAEEHNPIDRRSP